MPQSRHSELKWFDIVVLKSELENKIIKRLKKTKIINTTIMTAIAPKGFISQLSCLKIIS